MEIRFRLNANDVSARADAVVARRLADHERQLADIRVRLDAWMRRWLSGTFLMLPPGIATLFMYWQDGVWRLPSVVALLIVWVIYILLWLRFGRSHKLYDRLLNFNRRQRQGLDNCLRPRIARWLRCWATPTQGDWLLCIEPAALRLMSPRGRTVTAPWSDIARVRECDSAYEIATAIDIRRKRCHLVPLRSQIMDEALYKEGLAQLLSRCPPVSEDCSG